MSDDFFKKNAIDGMVAATEHIRDCERCRRVYGAAFNVTSEAHREKGIKWIPPSPWEVFFHCSRELRACEHWPNGI
jgi:hypothetical protein